MVHSARFIKVYFELFYLKLSDHTLIFWFVVQNHYEYIFSCHFIKRIVKVHFDFICSHEKIELSLVIWTLDELFSYLCPNTNFKCLDLDYCFSLVWWIMWNKSNISISNSNNSIFSCEQIKSKYMTTKNIPIVILHSELRESMCDMIVSSEITQNISL